jgi:hypothetical protein
MKLEFSRKIIEKYVNLNFNENSCSGSRLFLEDERSDMTQLTVSYRC